jgi:ABC-type Fe3+ transport system substrate-binding protein
MLALTLSSCGRSDDPAIPELIIISPHGSDIRREFERGFSNWHQQKYGSLVKVRWPDVGGTGNIGKELDGAYKTNASSGYDLVFGGGSAMFEYFRQRGILERPPIDEALLAQIPKDIFGTPLHGAGHTWIAATMSNFGICYNKDRIQELGLKTPRMWEDLATGDWFGHLSLADPSKSGSVRSSYEQIFLQYGWEKGWGVLIKMFANTNQMREGGAMPSDDVGTAQAVAGIVIDFYGRKAVLRVGDAIAGFAIPEQGSVTDPDPIAMLKGAPHPELSARFIEFVISEEGQKLWTFRARSGKGGPDHYVLGRLAIRPDMYEKYKAEMFDPTNPFANPQPLKANEKETVLRGTFIGELIKAALIDNREALVEARGAIRAAGDPADLLAKLEAVPTFVPTRVEGVELADTVRRPVTQELQAALAAEFKPPAPRKDDPPELVKLKEFRQASAARLQQRAIDGWRVEFGNRFRELALEARTRKK